jgi:hypothetical protein
MAPESMRSGAPPARGVEGSRGGRVAIFGGRYGVSYEWLRASAMVYLPMTSSSSPVDYGPGLMLTVGVNLDLGWRRRDDAQAPSVAE